MYKCGGVDERHGLHCGQDPNSKWSWYLLPTGKAVMPTFRRVSGLCSAQRLIEVGVTWVERVVTSPEANALDGLHGQQTHKESIQYGIYNPSRHLALNGI